MASSSPDAIIIVSPSNDLYVKGALQYDMLFATTCNIQSICFGYSNMYMKIASNGNVGIGVTSPSYKLDVNGDINTNATIRSVTHSNSGNMQIGGNLGLGTDAPNYKLDVRGDIRATGTIYGHGVTSTSDIRKKKDIEPIKNALELVNKLDGKYFKMIDSTTDKRKIGLIAQDVIKVIPEVVSTDSEGFLSISYGSLVALLIESNKQLTSEINALKSQIAKLNL